MTEKNEKRRIVAKDLHKIVTIEDPRVSPDGNWVAYVKVTVDAMENGYQRHIWLMAKDGEQAVQVTRGGKDTTPRWSPDSTTLAFTSVRNDKPQVYLLPVAAPGGEARALTCMENGASFPEWSPDGLHIAFLSPMNAEEREKEDSGEKPEPPADKFEAKQRKERKEHDEKRRLDPRPVYKIPYRELVSYRDDRYAQIYIMAVGEDLEEEERKPRRLTDMDVDHKLAKWLPDGKSLLTSRAVDPERDEYWRWYSLYRIDVATGEATQLTDEVHTDFFPVPSPDGQWIAYHRLPVEGMTDALTRLAVIPVDGGEPRDLNLDFDRDLIYADMLQWLPDSSAVLFIAGDQGNQLVYRVSPDGGSVDTVVEGTIEITAYDVGPGGGVAFAGNTPVNPPELFRQGGEAESYTQLTELNKPLLDEIIVQETHEIRFTGSDGETELQGWVIYPVDYEEGRKVPLVFNIHGGPHVMWGPSARSMWHEWQFHAACGYAVFYMNPRGSNGYGQKFMRDLHGAWGDVAFDDLMAGVDEVLKLGFIDEDKMAVTGGSYGGYMTGWIVGHTDRFKSAVSQRGVYNLSSFYGTSDVPGLISNEYDVEPWEDHDLLWEHSPLAYAHKVKTPILLIHSDNDFRVPIEQAEQFFAYVRRATDTPVKLLRYPREGHELSRSGEPEHRVSRLKEMVGWFDKYLGMERSKEK
ncbi:MAG TPA: S9 family peptidase [Anaerolineae bacterium]|nr:S9 family peptidase [Anaerolineae bacterium]